MHLNYFKLEMTAEELKKERNRLWKLHHPDRAKEADKALKNTIMQRINAEYDYVLKNSQKEPEKIKYKTWSNGNVYTRTNENRFESSKRILNNKIVQNIFHALTNASGIDTDLLIFTLGKINNVDEIEELFFKNYGTSIHSLLNEKAPPLAVTLILSKLVLHSTNSIDSLEQIIRKIFKINL